MPSGRIHGAWIRLSSEISSPEVNDLRMERCVTHYKCQKEAHLVAH